MLSVQLVCSCCRTCWLPALLCVPGRAPSMHSRWWEASLYNVSQRNPFVLPTCFCRRRERHDPGRRGPGPVHLEGQLQEPGAEARFGASTVPQLCLSRVCCRRGPRCGPPRRRLAASLSSPLLPSPLMFSLLSSLHALPHRLCQECHEPALAASHPPRPCFRPPCSSFSAGPPHRL